MFLRRNVLLISTISTKLYVCMSWFNENSRRVVGKLQFLSFHSQFSAITVESCRTPSRQVCGARQPERARIFTSASCVEHAGYLENRQDRRERRAIHYGDWLVGTLKSMQARRVWVWDVSRNTRFWYIRTHYPGTHANLSYTRMWQCKRSRSTHSLPCRFVGAWLYTAAKANSQCRDVVALLPFSRCRIGVLLQCPVCYWICLKLFKFDQQMCLTRDVLGMYRDNFWAARPPRQNTPWNVSSSFLQCISHFQWKLPV